MLINTAYFLLMVPVRKTRLEITMVIIATDYYSMSAVNFAPLL